MGTGIVSISQVAFSASMASELEGLRGERREEGGGAARIEEGAGEADGSADDVEGAGSEGEGCRGGAVGCECGEEAVWWLRLMVGCL